MSELRRVYDVVGSGSMVLDRILRVPRLLGPDEKVELGPATGDGSATGFERGIESGFESEHVGGVTLNHLGWASALGLRAAIFGKQADDPPGRALRAGMQRLGIEPHLDLSGSASARAHVLVDAQGERAIYMSRGATGELTPEDVERQFAAVIERSERVTSEVSQLPLRTVLRIFELAERAGAIRVLDVDLPRSEAVPWLGSAAELEAVLAQCDVLKLSRAALAGWIDARDPERAVRDLLAQGTAGTVLLTLGAEGAMLGTQAGVTRVPACEVDVRDSTGAGDAFLGGFLAGSALGLDPLDAVRLGNASGATCCEQLGGYPVERVRVRERILGHFKGLGGQRFELSPVPPTGYGAMDPATRRFLEVARIEVESVARSVATQALRAAAERVLEAERQGGRVHVTGIGKPAHVASYTAALLSSTGTPASFLDASEATHGSAGQVCRGDVVLAISNSGTTPELLAAVEALAARGASIIGVTAQTHSPLAQRASLVLEARVQDEGGPLGLAPRASILAELVVLQALSVELQVRRDFSRADYHARHPGGALGLKSRS